MSDPASCAELGFVVPDRADEIIIQPEPAQQAFADAVADFSAACPKDQVEGGCEDKEADGQQACAECLVNSFSQGGEENGASM